MIGWTAAAVLVAACGTDKGGGPSDDGAIAITLSKTALVAQQGGSDNLVATITRSGGFTGDVNIVTEGAPGGVTAAASNVTTANGTTTGTITVTVGAAVAPGTYNLTVRATGQGVDPVTKAVTLTVTAPPAIALALASAGISLEPGTQGTVNLTLTRTNFTGAVTFAVEGAPEGVTGTFEPNATTTSASVLTLVVDGELEPGTYDLTVRASGTGVTAVTQPLTLTVEAVEASYTLAASTPGAVAVGGTATSTITVTRSNFTDPVDLSLEGVPEGIAYVFVPLPLTGTTSTLTMTVGGPVAPGEYELTVRGEAEGLDDRTATFTLTVTPAGGYTLSTTPASTTVQVGGAATNVTININRSGGFAGSVALEVSNISAGLTATVTPPSTTGTTASLTLQAASGAATGLVGLVITGTAAGLTNQTTTLNVDVTIVNPGGGNVTLDYSSCADENKPIWLAYQNGTAGTWTRVVPTGLVFNFDITEAKGGLAIVTATGGGGNGVSVQYYTKAEMEGLTAAGLCTTPPAGKTVLATATNLVSNANPLLSQVAMLALGGGIGTASPLSPVASITGVQNGTFDLFGYAKGLLAVGPTDRIFIRRDVNTTAIAPGASIGTVDFTGGESYTPGSAVITIGNAAGSEISHSMGVATGPGCTEAPLYASSLDGAVGSITVYGIPNAQVRGGDYHNISLIAAEGTTTYRFVNRYLQALSDQTVNLPSIIGAFTPSALGGPYKRLRFQYTLPADVSTSTTASFIHPGTSKMVTLSASSGFLGGPAVDLSVPDFSGVAGWDNAWAPASAATVEWQALGSGLQPSNSCATGSFLLSGRAGTT